MQRGFHFKLLNYFFTMFSGSVKSYWAGVTISDQLPSIDFILKLSFVSDLRMALPLREAWNVEDE